MPTVSPPCNKNLQAEFPRTFKKNDVIGENFKVQGFLGQGGFGFVYDVREIKSNKIYALKIDLQPLRLSEPGVLLRLGKNLTELRRMCPHKKFTCKTTLPVAYQCLEAIEAMHIEGLLHRDIKPSNFVVGLTNADSRRIFLLDFGLVRRYKNNAGDIRQARPKVGFRGTPRYASPNVLSGRDCGRCDDVVSWMYLVIECFNGDLPWQFEADRAKVLGVKLRLRDQPGRLLIGLRTQMVQIYNSALNLNFSDAPPYANYKTLINETMAKEKVSPVDPFDWQPGGSFNGWFHTSNGSRLAHELENQSREGSPPPTAKTETDDSIEDSSE